MNKTKQNLFQKLSLSFIWLENRKDRLWSHESCPRFQDNWVQKKKKVGFCKIVRNLCDFQEKL